MRKSLRTSKSYLIEGKLVKKGTRIIIEEFDNLGGMPSVDPEREDLYAMKRKRRLRRISRMDLPSEDMESVGEEAMNSDSPVETMRRARMARLRRMKRVCKKAEDGTDDSVDDIDDIDDNVDDEPIEERIRRMKRLRRMRRK